MKIVLVVDDEPLIAMALEAELVDAGYDVATAANGRQGLDRLRSLPRPDLVLTDMMMPVMGGAELLATICADPELRRIPVVIISSLPEATVRAAAAEAAGFLRKPCTADEMLSLVARILQDAG